jgi:phytoene desaturase (3,4-didehydrolycopene-forming)
VNLSVVDGCCADSYNQMSPYDAPGTYSLLQYAELVRAIWYPIGGFHKVVEALVNVGKRYGVTYRLNTPVAKVNISADGSRATGVTLESGEVLDASLVVCNADLVYAYNNLFPTTPYAKSLKKRPASCSSISFYWALDQKVPELKTHNIFLAGDYKASFEAIFTDHKLPEEPSFYVNVPSRVDPTAAPEGKDAVIVLIPLGHLLEEDGEGLSGRLDWEDITNKLRQVIVKTMEARIGVNVGKMIVKEQINNPLTCTSPFFQSVEDFCSQDM